MKRLAGLYPAALLVVGLAACSDRAQEKLIPLAPKAAQLSLAADAGATDAGDEGSASACIAYTARRDAARKQLAAAPSDVKLQDKVESLQEIVADVCN